MNLRSEILSLLGAISISAAGIAASAAEAREIGIYRTCSFTAFVTETDPNGINVRSGPSASFEVVGKLPPVYQSSDQPPVLSMVEVTVEASQNGWFRVRDAHDNELLVDSPRKMYAGAGWVSGRLLTVKSQAPFGRDVPHIRGETVKLGALSFDADSFLRSSRISDCTGKWALAENEKYKFRGWLNRLCGIQETSCGGD